MTYFRRLGQLDRANQELEAAIDLGFGGRWTEAVEAYARIDQESARQLFQAGPYQSSSMPIWLAFVEAEESPERALKAYREIAEAGDASLRSRVGALAILLLIGANCEDVQMEVRRIDADFAGGFESVRSFLRGEIEPADFVGQDEAQWMKQTAHYWIGLVYLNQGNREEAEAHFEKARENFSPGWPACHWSRAFLERLKADPAWPARIQLGVQLKQDSRSELSYASARTRITHSASLNTALATGRRRSMPWKRPWDFLRTTAPTISSFWPWPTGNWETKTKRNSGARRVSTGWKNTVRKTVSSGGFGSKLQSLWAIPPMYKKAPKEPQQPRESQGDKSQV